MPLEGVDHPLSSHFLHPCQTLHNHFHHHHHHHHHRHHHHHHHLSQNLHFIYQWSNQFVFRSYHQRMMLYFFLSPQRFLLDDNWTSNVCSREFKYWVNSKVEKLLVQLLPSSSSTSSSSDSLIDSRLLSESSSISLIPCSSLCLLRI